MSFQIGDRVRFVCDDSPETREYMKGMTGTIIEDACRWDWKIKLDNPINNDVTCADERELTPLTDSDITTTITVTLSPDDINLIVDALDYTQRQTLTDQSESLELRSRLLNYIQ